MTSWSRETSKHIGMMALVLAASHVGIVGCGSLELEPIEQSTSALGSVKGQQTISTWTQLTQMVSDGNYLLTTTLNAAGRTWTPKLFTGTFDGGGNTISNLTINVTNGTGAGFFETIRNGIVRNVRFVNLQVTGNYSAGGVAGFSEDSLIELVGVEGTISAPGGIAAGGIVGMGGGSNFTQCYMKGTVSSARRYAGGITAYLNAGTSRGRIYQSYVWATVSPDTSEVGRTVIAGGIAGWTFGSSIQEIYAVGNVTGRGHVGGLVGRLTCDGASPIVLNHGIYRGEVVDRDRPPASGGWAGTFGTYQDCVSRFDQLIWDRTLDGSTNFGVRLNAQKSATTQELMSPTTAAGGVYSSQDNTFLVDFWEPGSASRHHALQNMPGGLSIQPRCVVNGVPTAC